MTVVRALTSLATGDAEAALRVLASTPGPLARELAEHLAVRHDGRVYDDPAAFQAFIDGGGNVELYRATSAHLAAHYRTLPRPASVLDLGCGDGRAVLPAAAELGPEAPTLDLVEPSAALLTAAVTTATQLGLHTTPHQGTAQHFLDQAPHRRWSLAESTFALHALPPAERTDVLARLREIADAIVLVEFDVPAFADGSPEHLAYLAERYERGLAEYDGSLVAQGFLMPVLAGQLHPDTARNTWEQPAATWTTQLADAGWHHITLTPIADYWWAPAFAATAHA